MGEIADEDEALMELHWREPEEEGTCCRCFLKIHRDDPVDYLGDRIAHRYPRCVELLRAEIARLQRARAAQREGE